MATRTWIGTTSGDWAVTTNWQEGSVPIAGDDVVIKNNAVAITASLNQSAVTLASFTCDSTYTGTIGSSSAYLQVGATLVSIGAPSNSATAGTGSPRIKLDFGSVQTTITVYSTCATTSDAGLEPFRWKGTHASNKCYVVGGGRVGVATTLTSEVATLTEWDVTGSGAVLNLGPGCTLTTGYATAGNTTVNSTMTTLTVSPGATVTTQGTGAVTTANVGGTLNSNSSGTITTCNLYAQGRADFSQNPASRAVTTLNHYKTGVLAFNPANPAHLTLTTYNKLQGTTLTLN